jgi:tetratricopeptide (TPR) repeat protein
MAVIEAELPNIRVALRHAIDTSQAAVAHGLVAGAWFFWMTFGHAREGDGWMRLVAELPSEPTKGFAEALAIAGEFPRARGDAPRALELKRRAKRVFKEIGDDFGLALTHSDLAVVLGGLGEIDAARAEATEALRLQRRLGRPFGVAHALFALGGVELFAGELERARVVLGQSIAVAEEGGLRYDAGNAMAELGQTELLLGDRDAARDHIVEAWRRAREAGDEAATGDVLVDLGLLQLESGDAVDALRLFGNARRRLADLGLVPTHPAALDTGERRASELVTGVEAEAATSEGEELTLEELDTVVARIGRAAGPPWLPEPMSLADAEAPIPGLPDVAQPDDTSIAVP